MIQLDKSGDIVLDDYINLEDIIESGQTFLWNHENNKMFKNKDNLSYTTAYKNNNKKVIIKIRQNDNRNIHWISNADVENEIRERLGLNHNIDEIKKDILRHSDDDVINNAIDRYNSIRLVNEPIFPTLISFICSTQMRIERIHSMINSLRKECGSKIETKNNTYYTFPTLNELSEYDETDFKQLNIGYRSKYLDKTIDILSKDNILLELPKDNNECRKKLEQLMGVGTKVADCTLLYGTDRLNVVPVDTWIDKLAKKYYSDIYDDNKSNVARNLENKFGKYSGYAQLYLFRYIRDVN